MNASLLIGKINTLADTDVTLLLYHLPVYVEWQKVRVAFERGSITMSHVLCSTYQVELPEVKVASNGETNASPSLCHLPIRIARSDGCPEC